MTTFIPDGYRAFKQVADGLIETDLDPLRQRIYDGNIPSVIIPLRGPIKILEPTWCSNDPDWTRALDTGFGSYSAGPEYLEYEVTGQILLDAAALDDFLQNGLSAKREMEDTVEQDNDEGAKREGAATAKPDPETKAERTDDKQPSPKPSPATEKVAGIVDPKPVKETRGRQPGDYFKPLVKRLKIELKREDQPFFDEEKQDQYDDLRVRFVTDGIMSFPPSPTGMRDAYDRALEEAKKQIEMEAKRGAK